MIKVTAAELQRNIGRYQDIALSEPVAITRHGRERTVLISIDEYHRLTHQRPAADADEEDGGTGESLIRAIQASPYRDIEINPERMRLPVRDVEL